MQTTRLNGFIPTIEFLEELTAMFADKDFIDCYGVYFDRKTCKERILSDIKHWQDYDFGPFYFRDKITNEFVGRGGLKSCEILGEKEVELTYALNRKFWGSGIASEIAVESIKFAKNLSLKNLVCFTRLENEKSLRVMKKHGFIYKCDFTHNNLPHKLHHLKISEGV